jgi:hypothetical protein
VCVTAEIELEDKQKVEMLKKGQEEGEKMKRKKERKKERKGAQLLTLVPNRLPHLIHLMMGTIQQGHHVVDLHSFYCTSLMWVCCIHQAAL